jgi:FkbM family methyltransferase
MKNRIYDLLRPFYGPITKAVRGKLVTEQAFVQHPEMAIPRPWDYVQFQAERNLHAYLHTSRDQINNVVIVGAYDGSEVKVMEKSYPNAHFTLFEPSPKNFPLIQKAFADSKKVKCVRKACGEEPGAMSFYELPMEGNGSLLKPDPEEWQRFTQWPDNKVTEHKVDVTTLDLEISPSDPIDLLWVDVQGAELQVLRGAKASLSSTKAVFLEVALAKSPYSGGALLHELSEMLQPYGHQLVLLGLDPWNFTGNALWLKDANSLVTKS